MTGRRAPQHLAARRGSPLARLGVTALSLALFGAAFAGTFSVFTSTASNSGNTVSTGTVSLTDNDAGGSMLGFTTAKPGDTDTSCIRATYTGSLASTVHLYGTTTGSGLDPYLTLTVTRGTGAATFDSCTGFTPDSTDYLAAGNGVVYTGTLQGFADSYAAGIVDPIAASPETWTTSETHDFKFVLTVADNNSAQGKTATQVFTWEARSS